MKEDDKWQALARFLFEAQMMKRTPRTGFIFLGKGEESIAEHTFGVMINALALSSVVPEVNLDRLLRICLIHDMAEVRTGDANAVYKLYVDMDEEKAFSHMLDGLEGKLSRNIKLLFAEYKDADTLESMLAHDADQLDMLLSLKISKDTGSADAIKWIPYVKARLKTQEAIDLAEALLSDHWASWWMHLFGLNDNDPETDDK